VIREEALTLLALPQEQAIKAILELANKAALWEQFEAKDSGKEKPSPTQPSGMTPPYLKPVKRKRRRKPGRKNGHAGQRRPTPNHIDVTHLHDLKQCPDCGHAVGDSCRDHDRIIEDIPPVTPEVHLHRIKGSWCGHCKKIVTPVVTDALPRATLGLNVVIYSAWLHYLLGVSVGNIARLLSIGYAFKVSTGGLTQAWANLAEQLEPYYRHLEQQVCEAGILHADETGWRINGVTHWLWAFCTENLCYYLIDRRRSSAVVARVLGEFFDGILITDFYGAYNLVEAWAKQRCFFHLFTELLKVDKRNDHPPWREFRRRLSRLLKDAMRLHNQRKELDERVFERRKHRIHQRFDQLADNPYDDDDARRLAKRLQNFRGELLTFLDHEGVPPTNNFAEQQMRKPVVARKVCQQNRSDRGAKTHAILLSLFRTAELQGHQPVDYVISLTKAAIAGNPAQFSPTSSLKEAA
jgi:transposase